MVNIPEIALIQLSSWRWAQSCSKHVEDSNKHIIEEVVCQVCHLPELYEDARSEKYKIPLLVVTLTKFCLHRMYNMCICIMRGCSITCALEGDGWSALPRRRGRMEGLVGSRVGLDALWNILLALSDNRKPFCRSSSPWSIYCTDWATPAPQFHDEPLTSIECSSEAVNANPLSYKIKVAEVSFRKPSQH
jgi:hypothetical protein